jgi:hypothetical protein
MSQIAIAAVCLNLVFHGGYCSLQDCTLAGARAWSDALRCVVPDCDNRVIAPDGQLILRVDPDGRVRLDGTRPERDLHLSVGSVEAPAMMSWSPRSNAFFLNDGEGSGQTSVFRLFRVNGRDVVEDGRVGARAVAVYRKLKRCQSGAANPNVWGLGWSPDGAEIYLWIQTTIHAPCGERGSFIGMIVRLSDDAIVGQLSQKAAAVRFRTLLPPGVGLHQGPR